MLPANYIYIIGFVLVAFVIMYAISLTVTILNSRKENKLLRLYGKRENERGGNPKGLIICGVLLAVLIIIYLLIL